MSCLYSCGDKLYRKSATNCDGACYRQTATRLVPALSGLSRSLSDGAHSGFHGQPRPVRYPVQELGNAARGGPAMRGRRDAHGASSGDAEGTNKWVWPVAQTTRARWAQTGHSKAGEPMAVVSPAASRVSTRARSWSVSGSRVGLLPPLQMVRRARSPL